MNRITNPDPSVDPPMEALIEELRPTPLRDRSAALRGKDRFLAEIDYLFESKVRRPPADLWPRAENNNRFKEAVNMTGRKQRFALTAFLTLALFLAILFSGASMTVYAAQSALPGQALYPVKTGLEQTQISLSLSAAGQAQLHLEFAQRRLDEIKALIAAGKYGEIQSATAEFEEHVQAAIRSLQTVAAGDPARAQSLAAQISTALAQYAQALSAMLAQVPEIARPAMERAIVVSQQSGEANQEQEAIEEFSGSVEVISPQSWTIAGWAVAINAQTEIEDGIQVGDTVKVHAFLDAAGVLTAREIERSGEDHPEEAQEEIEIKGVVETMTAQAWTVAGRTLLITPQTQIEGAIQVGDPVEIKAIQAAGGSLTAVKIEAEDQQDENGPSQGEMEEGEDHEGSIEQNEDGEHNSGDDLDEDHDDDDHSAGIQGPEMHLSGTVEAISATSLTVSGHVIQITGQTKVEETIQTGDTVEVRAVAAADGSLTALRIERSDESMGEDGQDEEIGEDDQDDEHEDEHEGEDGGQEGGGEHDDGGGGEHGDD